MTKTLKTRETALARAEEKIAALTERNGHLEADVQVSRTNIEKRVEDLNSALQRERMERAVVEGALEAARKDNSRLQSEVGGAALDAAARRCRSMTRRWRRTSPPTTRRRPRARRARARKPRKPAARNSGATPHRNISACSERGAPVPRFLLR